MPPNYKEIAERIHRCNCTPEAIATALYEAYRRGATDGLSDDDVDALVRRRVAKLAMKTDDLSRRVGDLAAELRGPEPVDVGARANGGLRRGRS